METAVVQNDATSGVTTSLVTADLNAFYGPNRAFADISLEFAPNAVTALMGPSGCGKTTLLRCLNRIHEITPGAKISGAVQLNGEDVYSPDVSPIALRRRVGMVFQRPNPFPTLSIFSNVVAGLSNRFKIGQKLEIGERSLRAASLWNEVKDRLNVAAASLSGGQQQRLCIARALAVEPEVLLMDEPSSSLDPISTEAIEELVRNLAKDYTIVIVTHNMQQAARISDFAAFLMAGEDHVGRLIEFDRTDKIFTRPADRRTEDYITGRFG